MIRVSYREFDRINREAKALGVSLSKFCRLKSLGSSPADLLELRIRLHDALDRIENAIGLETSPGGVRERATEHESQATGVS